MSSVIYAKRFLDTTAALAPRDRKVIDSAVMEFARGSKSKGLRLHKLNCRESRFFSISANKDLRIIVLIDGDTRIVMHAGPHDSAYRWAERHEVRTHEVTGAPQIIEFVENVEKRIHFAEDKPRCNYLFCDVEDEQLSAIGVPLEYIRLVRKVGGEDDLIQLSGVLPEEAWEALVDISSGVDPDILIAELALQRASLPKISTSGNESLYSEIVSSQVAQQRFWVADSEQELAKALDMPWAAWRVFLHPSQAEAVNADHAGAARITGGAGTGKSVVLVHRAVRLVRESKSSRVLLSTFSKVLAEQLAKSVDELLGDEDTFRQRIEVTHLHKHAFRICKRAQPKLKLATTAAVEQRLDTAVTYVGYLAHPMAFVRDEWHHVVDYWGVKSIDSYLSVSRVGRGKALQRYQREVIWPVFKHVLDGLVKDNLLTRAAICERAVEGVTESQRYDCVLLDEAQDFTPRELRYAHSLSGTGENSLFLGGDDGQRIYQNSFPLKSIGINIRGRSKRLRVNYRTSAEIHDFSINILPNELENGSVETRRVTSLFGGVSPQVVSCRSFEEETAHLVDWVADCQEAGVSLGEIALLARQRKRLQSIVTCLEEEFGYVATILNERDNNKIVADTLHAAKGLEFRAVAVVGAEEGILPLVESLEGEPGDEAHSLALARERHLLYVGCTRARETLLVTHCGEPSRFLPEENYIVKTTI